MTNFSEELTNLIEAEKEYQLDAVKVDQLPLWRLIRFRTRIKHLRQKKLFVNNSKKRKLPLLVLMRNVLLSLSRIMRVLLSRKKYDNLFFTFGRLTSIDGAFFCKFTDPIIELAELQQSSLTFEKSLSGEHKQPRQYTERVLYADFLELVSALLAVFLFPIFFMRNKKAYTQLAGDVKKIYGFSNKDYVNLVFTHCTFTVHKMLIKQLLRRFEAKKVYVVSRMIFLPIVAAAKELGIATYELQHGITTGETVLYSGVFDPIVDTDYFLGFGEASLQGQFYVPNNTVINIGFAYKTYLLNSSLSKENSHRSQVLLVSSPNITDKILTFAVRISLSYPDKDIRIRLHPQEGLSEKHKEMLVSKVNIFIDDEIDSVVSCLKHDKIIGDKSSVLYEAQLFGKAVAKINFDGFINDDQGDGFYYLNSIADLEAYLENDTNNKNKVFESFYSDFDKQHFLNLG